MSPLKLPGRLRPWILLASALFLGGCQSAILNPKDQFGIDQRNLLLTWTVLLLMVVVPVVMMALVLLYRYRASRQNRREPDWYRSTPIEILVWAIPCLIIVMLGVLVWRSPRAPDASGPLDSDAAPLTTQALSPGRTWLSLAPGRTIATTNEAAFRHRPG